MSDNQLSSQDTRRPFIARNTRRLAVPIILGWLVITLLVTLGVPALEQVAQEHSVSLSPKDAPSVKAAMRMGEIYKESSSDSVALILLEGQQPLGDAAHKYYDSLIRQLKADPAHVEHLQDYWGDPLTAVGAQSDDGKAAYVQLSLAGNQGQPLSNQSVEAVRKILQQTPAPPGVKSYLTGPAALVADTNNSGNKSLIRVTAVTVAVIFIMLLLVYRSVVTVIVLLGTVGIELLAARGVVAFFGYHGFFGLSTFAINLLVSLAIAAGTDYGIFFIGRYQEARQAGQDLEAAYYTTCRGVSHVVLASGLTIAGAVFCLSFTRMPYFQTLGAPCAIGMLVAVAIALTLVPAVLTVAGRFGLLEPKRKLQVRRWRRVGTAIVRWPAPIFAATCVTALVGLLALPGYRTSYNDRQYIPQDLPANLGYVAAERHFSEARLTPEVLLIESDHDLRNPADFIILDKLAKAVFKVRGISSVQAITRPDGTALAHTSIPFQMSLQNAGQLQTLQFQKKSQDDLLKQADSISNTIDSLERMSKTTKRLTDATHRTVVDTKELEVELDDIRDDLANFDDFFRPIRNYFYWEPHCYDIPICYAFRSLFDSIDGLDQVSETTSKLVANLDDLDAILPQTLEFIPVTIENLRVMRKMLLSTHSTTSGILAQIEETSSNATAMGKAFDAAKNDDSFYLPPEVFENPEFKRAENLFLSPDGKAARLIISQRGDPATPEGISRIEPIKVAAEEALKGTPLKDAKIYLAGTASTFKDLQQGSNYDLLIAGVISLCLIFTIMLILTRSLVAALTIVGTVTLSLGASFGLSVLVWQYILGMPLHWLVLAMSVLILLAVGSDYNLLLVSRFKEEIGAGIKTGIIRAMGGTGKVVTTAGLVFAFTMASMVVSDLRIIGQIGTTIGLGLLFDTLIVRSFMTPSIAALLGRWFWWPQRVRPAPASPLLQPVGPRPLVRALLLPQDGRKDDEGA